MIFDLTSVFADEGAEMPVECMLDMSDADFGGIKPLVKPVKISARVYNRAGIVALEGAAECVFNAPCDLCASDFEAVHNIPLEHTFVTLIHNEDNAELVIIPDMKLNADELFRSDVLLGLPSRHLCSPDCKGVCGGCGRNLNSDACVCQKSVDPRLQALADLLDK